MTHDNVTGIVERLAPEDVRTRTHETATVTCDLLTEAADTIATLRKQLENARDDALEEAAMVAESHSRMMNILDHTDSAKMIGRKILALKGQP